MPQNTLYRCPRCSAVLVRTPENDELMQLISEKANYQCGHCGHMMPASEVLSGRYDIENPASDVSAISETGPSPLPDVLAKLKREHVDGYVYRGQPKEWPGALLPSVYRGMLDSTPLPSGNPSMRLREVGNEFHELLSTALNSYSPTKLAQMQAVNYLTQTFGYPLSQLLAQQCGLTSEGLDVTTDPDVAAFFATFDFSTGRFVDSDGIGVIYRFKVPIQTHGVKEFKEYDFYSCPVYLNPAVFELFAEGNSLDESFNSFLEYVVAYGMNSTRGIEVRPLEILKLPLQALKSSRVVQQCAGLLMPDQILTRFYATLAKPAPVGKAEKDGLNAVENLATRSGTEKFFFQHSQDSQKYINADVHRIFPQEDPFKMLLIAFLDREIGKFIFTTELGSFGNPGGAELLE